MGEGLARRHLVECLVGDGLVLPADRGEDLADLGLPEPGDGGVGALGFRDRPEQWFQVGADLAVIVPEELPGLPGEDAPLAGAAAAQDPGFPAFRAAVPEAGVGVDAPGAQSCRARLRRRRPWCRSRCTAASVSGSPRTTAGRWPWRSRRASHGRKSSRPARGEDGSPGRAARPGPDRDPAALAAPGAVFQVGRVADQAVRAEWSAVGVPGGRFPHRAAAAARDGLRPGAAGPADALAV